MPRADAQRDATRGPPVLDRHAAGAAAPRVIVAGGGVGWRRLRRFPLRGRCGTGRCARARRGTAPPPARTAGLTTFSRYCWNLSCSLIALRALIARATFTSRASAVYSPKPRDLRDWAKSPCRSALCCTESARDPPAIGDSRRRARRGGCAPAHYFFLRFSSAIFWST